MAKFLKGFKKASKEPPTIEEKRVEYVINKHCEKCPNEIKHCIEKEKGVATVEFLEEVEKDEETGQDQAKILAIVHGRFDENRLQSKLWRKTSKIAKIVSSQIVESGGGDSNSDGDNINEKDDNYSDSVSQMGSQIKGVVSVSPNRGEEINDNVSEAASISSRGSRASRGSKASKRSNASSSSSISSSHFQKSADVGSPQSSLYGSAKSSFSH